MQLFSWLRKRMTEGSQTRRAPARQSAPYFRPRLEVLEGRLVPSTLTVTNNLDNGAGSLRADIATANPGDTINFAPSLAGQIIKLTSGELLINKSLTVQGLGAGQLTVSGGNASRVFDVSGANTNVTLSGLTITQGNARSSLDSGDGGGILNLRGSTLTLNGCTVSNNQAPFEGGGIANLGATLNVINSTVSGNVANNSNGLFGNHGVGGGVYSAGGSQLSMTDCTVSHNYAGSEGGGISIFSTSTTIDGCILSGNYGGIGSAIYNGNNFNMLMVSDSLFSSNSPTKQFPIYGPWTNGGGDIFE